MKTSCKMSKRAQRPSYAVPLILASTLAFLFLYLLMVYPEERALLLGQNVTKNESPLGPGTEIIFSDGYFGEIGIATGRTEFSMILGGANLTYPALPMVVDELNNAKLKTSIFSTNIVNLNANNINLENTQQVYLLFNITDVKGTPKLIVLYNQTIIHEKEAVEGETIVSIPADMLKENNPVSVKLKHNGAFWKTQEIEATVKAIQVYYYRVEKDVVKENAITIGSDQFKGSIVRMTMNITEVSGVGNLLVRLNDQTIYSGKPDTTGLTVLTERISETQLRIGENKIVIEADRGSSFNIQSALFELVSESAPVATKTYSFDIPRDKLESDREIKVGLKVDRIISHGFVYLTLQPNMGTYYFSAPSLAAGSWSYETLDKTRLEEFGNKIFVNSPDGRFVISGFMIILV